MLKTITIFGSREAPTEVIVQSAHHLQVEGSDLIETDVVKAGNVSVSLLDIDRMVLKL